MTTTAASERPARGNFRIWIGAAIVIIIIGIATAFVGARDLLERRRLFARASAAIESRDLRELEAVERDLDAAFQYRQEHLPPRRDGILNELGGARERVREEIAAIRSSR